VPVTQQAQWAGPPRLLPPDSIFLTQVFAAVAPRPRLLRERAADARSAYRASECIGTGLLTQQTI
jgi:hypothetical protein